MQADQPSSSTRARYQAQQRQKNLAEFMAFKHQFQHTLSDDKIEQLKAVYPHGILGSTQQGSLVVLDRIGSIKIADISKVVDDDQFVGYILQRLLHISEQVLQDQQKVVWVIDLSGKILQLACKKTYGIVERVVAQAQKFFPGMLHRLYFINTPMLFDAIWNKISNSIDLDTVNKVVLLSDELEELEKEVQLALLPECLGGTQSDEVLYRCEETCLARQQHKQQQQPEQEQEQEVVDFSSLKMALSGLKLGNAQHPSVANTPLNTQADDP